jgi:uncharacterized membrane protein (UPF0182 family)
MRAYISRFERLFDNHTIFGGVTYTDAHVMLTGMLVVCAALIVGAAIAAINVVSAPRVRWLLAAIAPAVGCYLVLQIVGWYVSSFIVKPNELVRERPFIAYNIELTRQAYGLDRLSQHEFPAATSVDAADPANNQPYKTSACGTGAHFRTPYGRFRKSALITTSPTSTSIAMKSTAPCVR